MRLDLKIALFALFWFIVGGVCGFFVGKGMYDQPIEENVVRDTVTLRDTIPQYFPQPVGGTKVRTEYKFLTRVVTETDTIFRINPVTDSVLVEVPIESRHYSSPEYDAWVSGYEPSLDSIKVYRETQYITETVTKSKPPNRFSIGLQGGYGYGFKSKTWEPYVGVGIGIKIF